MKGFIASEKLLIEEVVQAAQKTRLASRGLSIGALIKMIRMQLKMSQKVLARLACVPQSTISRIESGEKDANLSTLKNILASLSCDLIMVPLLSEPVDVIRRKQARKQSENHMRYLKGTMSLEKQQPDSRLLDELLKQEEEQLLQGPGSKLWDK